MNDVKSEFAQQLSAAMQAASHEAKPSVLEHKFNLRYWGRSITLNLMAVTLERGNDRTAWFYL